ncbi:MAG: MBL fold metallo-hydrolase [Bacteroidota bacterium]
MRIIFSIIGIIASSTFTTAQNRDTPDVIETRQGDVVIHPITHGTVAFTWGDYTIYVDPYGGAERFEGLKKPDIILITDIHGDHLNLKTLESLDLSSSRLFVPQAVMDELPATLKNQAQVLQNGSSTTFSGIEISAIPMYNLPDDETARHTRGRGNGYILNIGGMRFYLSGDTEDIPEMRDLKDIDVAFVCMNLPYTMDVDQAASAVLDFKPNIVYPYHYRGKGGLSDVEAFKKTVVDGNKNIEVRLKNWYPDM